MRGATFWRHVPLSIYDRPGIGWFRERQAGEARSWCYEAAWPASPRSPEAAAGYRDSWLAGELGRWV
jgi:hypothetical protein